MPEDDDGNERKERAGTSIVVPAYNEEAGIEGTLGELRQTVTEHDGPWEVIVVDDGSTDRTAQIAELFCEKNGRFYLHCHERNEGYGAALKRGIGAAQYGTIVITDADSTYPNDRIPQLARLLGEDVDMVVGWRKGAGAKIPLARRPAKWIVKKFAEWLAGYKIPDINSGLRVFRKQLVLDNLHVLPSTFSFTTTITLLVASGGGNIRYEPIAYHARAGKSKFQPIRDTWRMVTLIVRSVLLFSPLRIFTPIAAGLLALAGIVLIYSFFFMERILDSTVTILSVTGVQILLLGLLADLINRRM